MFIFRFSSRSANVLESKMLSKCKNKLSSTLIRNSLFFIIYNQKETPLGTVSRFIFCYSSHNYFYDVLFLSIRGNALLLTYVLTCLVACLLPSCQTFTGNLYKIILRKLFKFCQEIFLIMIFVNK